MNRKKKIILSAVLTAVGICAVILALVWRPQKPDAGLSPSHSAATTAPQETTGQSQTMEPDATEESTGPTASAPTASDPTWEPAPSGSATEPPEEASGSETEGSPETVAPTAPPETVAEQTGEISFPYAIADTGLVIQKIAAYDGVFL